MDSVDSRKNVLFRAKHLYATCMPALPFGPGTQLF